VTLANHSYFSDSTLKMLGSAGFYPCLERVDPFKTKRTSILSLTD
jgi:hypothetical protein